jgi:WD40 repeat protein
MLKETPGFVSMWVGDLSAKEANAYLKETYGEQERPISRFAADLGEWFYDHDFVETAHERKATSIEKLVEDSSYSRSYVAAAAKLAAAAKITSATFCVLMFDASFKGKWPKNAPVKFLGTTRYELQTAPAKRETFDYQGHEERVISMVFAPDGETLATGDNEGNVLAWKASQGRAIAHPRMVFHGALSSVYDIHFSKDGSRCAASSQFQSRVWSDFPGEGKLWPLLKVGLKAVSGCATLAAVDLGDEIAIFDLHKNKDLRRIKFSGERFASLPGDRWVAASQQNVVVGNFESKTIQRRTTKLKGKDGIATSPDGTIIAVWHGGSIELQNLTNAQSTQLKTDREIRLTQLGQSTMLVAPYRAPMEIWQYRTGTRKLTLNTGEVVYSDIALSDHEKIALGVQNSGDSLDLWQLPSGKRLAKLTKKDLKLKASDGISTAALAPNGLWLAVGMFSGAVRFFQIAKQGLTPIRNRLSIK